MIGALRGALERALFRELYGDNFRPDRPVETLGGIVRQLIDTKDEGRFRELQGQAKMILRVLEITKEETKEL